MQRPDKPRASIEGPEVLKKPYPIRLRAPVVRGCQRGSRQLGFPTANLDSSCLASPNCDASALDLQDGVYYGWVGLDFYSRPNPHPSSQKDIPDPLKAASLPESAQGRVFATALSVGMNPYFEAKQRTIELHILHDFTASARQGGYKPLHCFEGNKGGESSEHSTDIPEGEIFQFYGARANLAILGYIRPQYNYTTQDDLIKDIQMDVDVCNRSLARPAYSTNLLSSSDAPLLKWLIDFDWSVDVKESAAEILAQSQ